jgi:hypothetical protein
MSITVELPPHLEERFLAQARSRGLSLDAYVREVLALSTVGAMKTTELAGGDVDRLLDEAADLVPEDSPFLPDESLTREWIYSREDEW